MRQLKSMVPLLALQLVLPSNVQPQTGDNPARTTAEVLYAKLDTQVAQREFARADQTAQQLLGGGADRAATYFRIGKIYFDHEAWQRSAGFLEDSLKVNAVNDKVHQLLGLDWRELHRSEDAEAEFLEAARENPSDSVNAYLAGNQLLLNGKFEEALRYLYSALDAKPLQSQALQALALAQARLGNYGLAESYYRKVVDSDRASDDGNYSALINLSVLLLLGHDAVRLEEALTCARQAEKFRPDSPEAHFLAGKALFKLGHFREAIPHLERAAKLNPEDSKPHFVMARIYDQLGQHDRARKELADVARLQNHSRQAGMAAVDPISVVP